MFYHSISISNSLDAIAHESPVDDHESDYGLELEELEESREIFWERNSRIALLEPPSMAIVEGLLFCTNNDINVISQSYFLD